MKVTKNEIRKIILEEAKSVLEDMAPSDTNVNKIPDNTEVIELLVKVVKELRILNWMTAKTAGVYFAPGLGTTSGGPAGLDE